VPHPDSDWAASGCAALSGPAPAPIAACMRGAFAVFSALAPEVVPLGIDAPALLGERAAIADLEGRGRDTAGGGGRLVRARDGWLAVQLPRPDDVAALPAWLECEPSIVDATTPLDLVEARVEQREIDPLVERARILGLAVAVLPEGGMRDDAPDVWVTRTGPFATAPPRLDPARTPGAHRRLRVLDLSTLWAGPLCGRLLAWAGADVVKVEHPRRIDGSRLGPARFFDALNGDKSSLAMDATTRDGRVLLLDLVARADIVIESARPRGLAQLGIDARALVDAHPGLTWISITGYGRTPPRDGWVAFGDDAAVAAGLVTRDEAGDPLFCGDAIADPLTGVHAAAAALAGATQGGGLFDVPLAGVARAVCDTPFAEGRSEVDPATWRAPHSPIGGAPAPARDVGADTRNVRDRWLGTGARSAARC
ncbi:MAG: CoA transferase, partial [Actinomycetota bacterium]|nr:CoA transferase [Actinomycetota bacterium]